MTGLEGAAVMAEAGGVDPVLSVRGLTIAAAIGGRARTIVSGVDLRVGRGEAIAIVGESGSGKSLTARALMGLLPEGVRAQGEVSYAGRNLLALSGRRRAAFRGAELGMVLQDPFTMLNPARRCGQHIGEVLCDQRGRSLSRRARHAEAVRRLAEVGISDTGVVDAYPFQLSGGMRQRVAIAAALARDPEVLIADEPSTALDVTTQREILTLLKSLQRQRGMSVILITHDLRVAFSMCDRVYVLYAGSLLETGASVAVERAPLHPYTLGLLLSEPPADRRVRALSAIAGSVPSPHEARDGCVFAPRCRWAAPDCTAAAVRLAVVASGRESACVRLGEIGGEMSAARRVATEPAAPTVRTSGEPSLITVHALEKEFSTGTRRVRALAGVTIEVGPHESIGLVGESGSGKTTLGRCLVGLETPTGGQIHVGDLDVTDYHRLSSSQRRLARSTVQVIFQDPYSSLNPVRTIGATLSEALAAGPGDRNVGRAVGPLLERVGLPPSYAQRKPIALSGGERQRVAIARALAIEPKVIICDEPVSALDVSVQAQILTLFQELREQTGVSYLFITHDLAVVRQVADRLYVLYRGEIVEHGSVARVLDAPEHPYTRRLVESIPRADEEWLGAPHGATR